MQMYKCVCKLQFYERVVVVKELLIVKIVIRCIASITI